MSTSRPVRRRVWLLAVLALLLVPTSGDRLARTVTAPADHERPTVAHRGANPVRPSIPSHDPKTILLRAPLAFEPNLGQAAAAARFIAHLDRIAVAFLPDRALFTLPGSTEPLSLRLVGANPASSLEPSDPLTGRTNYIFGNDPSAWLTDISRFARLRYAQIYDGIDLVYYGSHERLEHDFIVAPHADPAAIEIDVGGATSVRVTPRGDAELHTPSGTVTLQRPIVYQDVAGIRQPIAAEYALRSGHILTFDLGPYAQSEALVIDPIVLFTAPIGGNAFTQANGVAVDSAGNIFVTGFTQATNFTVKNAAQAICAAGCGNSDGFVTALDTTGSTVLYSTYFGGSGIDQGLAIAVDPSGAAYLTGTTTSTDFPVKNAFQATAASPGNQHAFVAKLGATGALVYSTYLGGSGNEDFDNGFDGAIAADASGAAYVVGSTTSADFPVLNAFQGTRPGTTSAYVTKLAPSGSTLAYSTFLGGASTAGASHIAVDASGAAYVVGVTASANFPTTPGALSTTCPACSNFSSEAFVTKLTPAGSALAYSTFLGDIGGSSASGIAIDGAGAAYISGNTSSKNFPTVGTFAPTCIPCAHGLTSGFVSKLNPAGSALVYSNYIGAHGQTGVSSIAVDASGQAVVGGATDAPDFPSIQPVQALGGLGIGASTDVATSYVTSNQGFASSQTHALALDPSNPGVVYAATADGIFKSSNNGTSWATASAGLPVGANVQALAVQPGTGVVLAGVATKGVFKSSDGGASFAASNTNLPASPGNVGAIAFDPASPSTVYVGIGSGPIVFKSTNSGATWTRSDTNLPTGSGTFTVTGIVVDPQSSNTLYLSSTNSNTPRGVWTSTDGAVTWRAINTGLSTLAVNALAIDPTSSNVLYAATDLSFSPSGGVFKTVDAGLHWTLSLAVDGFNSQALAIDPTTKRVFAGLQNTGLAFSDDSGTSWNTSALTFVSVSAIAPLPGISRQLFGFEKSGGNSSFIMQFSADGSGLISSSYLGGPFFNQLTSLALDGAKTIAAVDAARPAPSANIGNVYPGANLETLQAEVIKTGDSHAELSVTKTVDKTSASVGDRLTWTITVTNHGPDPAVFANMTDMLPANMDFSSIDVQPLPPGVAAGINFVAGTIGCSARAALAVGETFSCTFSAKAAATGDALNSVVASSDSRDDGTFPLTAITHTTITRPIAATFTPSAIGITELVGDSVSLSLTATNPDPTSKLNVSSIGATCSANVTCSITADTCSGASVAPSSSCAASLSARCIAVGPITGSVTVIDNTTASPQVVSITGNCVASVADLSVMKTVDKAFASEGDTLTYTLTATNNGPNPAVNPQIHDPIPASLDGPSIQPGAKTGGATDNFSGGLGFYDCLGPDPLPVGASFSCTFTIRTASTGTTTNIATVTSNTPDSNGNNDNASAMTTITQPLSSIFTPSQISVGSIGVGSSASRAVVVQNPAPAANLHVTSVGATCGSNASCTITADTCTAATVAPAATCSYTVTALCTTAGSIAGSSSLVDNTAASPESIAITGACVPASSTSLTSSLPTAPFGMAVLLTATVTPSGTGTVTFLEGATTLGTGTVTAGIATLSISTLSAGTHSITAVYSGDASLGGSTSAALLETITKAPTMTVLAASPNPSGVAQAVAFTATVTPQATGTVTFLDGTSTLGTAALNASGIATFSSSALTAGVHGIVAQYGGDASFAGSNSAVLQQTVSAEMGYSLGANPQSLTVQSGSRGSVALAITPAGGFSGVLALSCADLPADVSCSFSQATATLDGSNTPVSIDLTIDTGGSTVQAASSRVPAGRGMLLLFGMSATVLGTRRRRRTWGLRAVLLLGLMNACGGTNAPQHTPPGTYSITVTAAGSVNHSTTVSLIVE